MKILKEIWGFQVGDLGCNDGKFLKRLTNDHTFTLLVNFHCKTPYIFIFFKKVGVDIDPNMLELGKMVTFEFFYKEKI